MTAPAQHSRGGVAVGVLSSLPPLEAGAVIYLRHWFSGAEPRAWMHADFAGALGAETAAAAVQSFGRLCSYCAEHGRRPLMRHGMSCDCLGADENCFANLIASAASGDSEDAVMLASLIVPPQKAPALAALALDTGLYLQGVTGGRPPRQTWRPGAVSLH